MSFIVSREEKLSIPESVESGNSHSGYLKMLIVDKNNWMILKARGASPQAHEEDEGGCSSG